MAFGEIESVLIKINGVWFDIHIDPDYDAKPGDYDCYDDADEAAFTAGHWRYVTVTVALHDHPTIRESLGAVEWGDMPSAYIGISQVVSAHVPELVSGLRSELAALLESWEA